MNSCPLTSIFMWWVLGLTLFSPMWWFKDIPYFTTFRIQCGQQNRFQPCLNILSFFIIRNVHFRLILICLLSFQTITLKTCYVDDFVWWVIFFNYIYVANFFIFPVSLLMKFILDGRTRKPFPLKVSRCTKVEMGSVTVDTHRKSDLFIIFFFFSSFTFPCNKFHWSISSLFFRFDFDIFGPSVVL